MIILLYYRKHSQMLVCFGFNWVCFYWKPVLWCIM